MIIDQKLQNTIRQYQMLKKGDRVILAVSGGPDSVCLADLFTRLSQRYQLKLHIIHFNHGLRKESQDDVLFVKQLSKDLRIPSTIKKLNIRRFAQQHKMSIENAGRQLRYQFLAQFARKNKFEVIATGHTLDDQVETVLHNIIRGSGIHGLAGIPPVRYLDNRIKIIRPLLNVNKSEILKYLRINQIAYRIDQTNLSTDFTRNRIRHEIIPLLEQINSATKNHLSHLAEIVFSEETFWQTETDKIFVRVVTRQNDGFCIDYNNFLDYNIVLQNRIIQRILSFIGDESYTHFNELRQLIISKQTGNRFNLANNWYVEKKYSKVWLYENKKEQTQNYSYSLKIPGVTQCSLINADIITKLIKPDTGLNYKHNTYCAYFDYATIKKIKLVVRNFRPGDWFYPFGMNGRKKLQDFFVDLKIEQTKRKTIPLVAYGQRIIWVVGYRTDNETRINQETKKIVELQYCQRK